MEKGYRLGLHWSQVGSRSSKSAAIYPGRKVKSQLKGRCMAGLCCLSSTQGAAQDLETKPQAKTLECRAGALNIGRQ